jgi:D-alanyl-lipoteichoic acid acyltransferase DltB (MBOAT superfamily)
MLFNSFEYLLFFPIVFALYWFVFNKSLQWQNLLVLVASYFFYGWWSWEFMLLLAFSTLLDFIYGFLVASSNRKKARFFLWLSIINNLGVLGVFKYYNFFAIQFQKGFEILGLHSNPVLLNIALPIGISFYTFHGMSYVFDIYRNKQLPVKNFVEYAVFVSFFPLLVAGPIERANHLLPQVQKRRFFNYPQAVEGCRLILWGMFKKVVIADSIAITVNDIFENYTSYNGATLVVGAIAFSIQIYGDFSGYSDIAIGSAKLFGFELLSNFKFPYFSRDIAEFWRRWHISLSSWFRDYLYIPLGGSKKGKIVAIRNTFIIFLVSGFWHGANWNFIDWGAVHACGFLPLLILNRNRKYVADVVAQYRIFPGVKELWQMISTFIFVSFAWIFFRTDEVQKACLFIKRMVLNIYESPIDNITSIKGVNTFLYIVPLIILDWYFRKSERVLKTPRSKILRYLIYILMCMIVLKSLDLFSINEKIEFIYFQF